MKWILIVVNPSVFSLRSLTQEKTSSQELTTWCSYESNNCFCLSRGVFDATLCDKACQWLATGRWFSPDIPVASTNTTDRHEIAELILNVVLSTITQLQPTYPENTNGASCLKFVITCIKISHFSKMSCCLNRFDCIILSCILFCIREQNEFRCCIVNLPHGKPSPGMCFYPPRNICYIVNLPPEYFTIQ